MDEPNALAERNAFAAIEKATTAFDAVDYAFSTNVSSTMLSDQRNSTDWPDCPAPKSNSYVLAIPGSAMLPFRLWVDASAFAAHA